MKGIKRLSGWLLARLETKVLHWVTGFNYSVVFVSGMLPRGGHPTSCKNSQEQLPMHPDTSSYAALSPRCHPLVHIMRPVLGSELNPLGVRISFYPYTTLRQLLVRHKDCVEWRCSSVLLNTLVNQASLTRHQHQSFIINYNMCFCDDKNCL